MRTLALIFLVYFSCSFYGIAQQLFDSEEILHITLSGEMKKLLKDKSNDPDYYPITFSYAKEDGSTEEIAIRVRTRGNFRRKMGHCTYLPLMLRFSKSEELEQSLFGGQKRLKLVMPCRGEKYVIREYLAYKVYNLVTPYSFKARLVKVTLDNTQSKKDTETFYGVLLEDDDKMAERNGMESRDLKLPPTFAEQETFLKMAVFEYLIGNTDWSVDFMQNIKLIGADPKSAPITVPYDFDHAGIVFAPYAHPASALKLSSVLERRYRGYCLEDLTVLEPILELYNSLKKDIYRVYTDSNYLDDKSKKFSVDYLDDFFETISNPKKWQHDFSYPCDPNGTGSVIIRGMKGR